MLIPGGCSFESIKTKKRSINHLKILRKKQLVKANKRKIDHKTAVVVVTNISLEGSHIAKQVAIL